MPEIKDQKETVPLLMDELSQPERVFLMQIVQHAGYRVLVKLFDAGCTRATQDIVRLNPEDARYNELLVYRSQRSRNINEFSALIMKSVDYHTTLFKAEEQEQEVEAGDAVAKVFGIHKVPPKAKKVIGKPQESSKEKAANESK